MQGKRRQVIFGLIGLGCGIVLSGILNLLLLLNTTEYKKGITLDTSQLKQEVTSDTTAGTLQTPSVNMNEPTKNVPIQEKTQEEILEQGQEVASTEKFKLAEDAAKEEEEIEITVTIPPNIYASETCEILEAAGVVKDAKDFKEYIREKGMTTRLREGTFVFRKNMAYDKILEKLMAY